MSDGDDRIDQIAARSRDLAASIESQAAAHTALAGRVLALGEHLEATQAAQAKATERIERLAVDLDLAPGLRALSEQVAALREAVADSSERIEALAAQLEETARLDAAIRHLRTEAVSRAEAAERSFRSELAAVEQKQKSDTAQLAREIHAVKEQLEGLRPIGDRLAGLQRKQTEAFGAQERLELRIEETASIKGDLVEMLRRSEQHHSRRIDDAVERIEGLVEDVAQWRARIESQSEAVREARGIADGMRAEADRLAEAHHATSEAERLFEDRALDRIAELRQEVELTWERFRQARDKQWAALREADAERDRKAARLDDRIAETAQQLDDMERALSLRVADQADDLHALRRDVAGAMIVLRDAASAAVGNVEAPLPSDEQSAESSARREALRRALREARERPER